MSFQRRAEAGARRPMSVIGVRPDIARLCRSPLDGEVAELVFDQAFRGNFQRAIDLDCSRGYSARIFIVSRYKFAPPTAIAAELRARD
jgi:hypothetical protein